MKKYFETPEVNSAVLPTEDIMAASAELVADKAGKLASAEDTSATAAEGIWTGTDGWK